MKLPLWAEYMAKAAHKMQPETTIEDHVKEVQSLVKEQHVGAKVMEAAFKEYARVCCEVSLKEAAENYERFERCNGHSTSVYEKNAITNPQNIILL